MEAQCVGSCEARRRLKQRGTHTLSRLLMPRLAWHLAYAGLEITGFSVMNREKQRLQRGDVLKVLLELTWKRGEWPPWKVFVVHYKQVVVQLPC